MKVMPAMKECAFTKGSVPINRFLPLEVCFKKVTFMVQINPNDLNPLGTSAARPCATLKS